MCGDFGFLQRMKLLEFVETERENIVIKGLGRAAEKSLEGCFITRRVSCIQANTAARLTARFSLKPQKRIADEKIERSSVCSAIHRLVAFCSSALFKAEQHRSNESHEGALPRLVRSVEDVQPRRERAPMLVVPPPETINVNVFDSHSVYASRSKSTPRAEARWIHSQSFPSSIAGMSLRRNN